MKYKLFLMTMFHSGKYKQSIKKIIRMSQKWQYYGRCVNWSSLFMLQVTGEVM